MSSRLMQQPASVAPPRVAHATASSAFRLWLRQEMRGRRLSQEQLAQRSGVHRSTISRILAGRRVPKLETAVRLARSLGALDGADLSGKLRSVTPEQVDAIALVERALRADERLGDSHVRRVMRIYLQLRTVPSPPSRRDLDR